jgi:hypothetical protein
MDSSPSKARIATDLLRWAVARQNLSSKQRLEMFERGKAFLPWLDSRKIDSLLYLAAGVQSQEQSIYNKVFALQLKCLKDILIEFENRQCRVIVFKGAEHLAARYASEALGWVSDADILVPRNLLESAKAILYSLGYRQSYFDGTVSRLVNFDVRDISQIEAHHYQLAGFCKLIPIQLDEAEHPLILKNPRNPVRFVDDEFMVHIEIDLHFQVSADYSGVSLWDRAESSSLGVGETLSSIDHLWFTLSRLYSEVALHGKCSLRDFAYVLPLLTQPLDWDVLLAMNRELNLSPGLYYYLRFAEYLSGRIPKEVLIELHPTRFDRVCDLGWQLGRLLDIVEEFPWAALE